MGPDLFDLALPLVIGVLVVPVSIRLREGYYIYSPGFDLVEGSMFIMIGLLCLYPVRILKKHPYVFPSWLVLYSVAAVRVSRT